MLAENLNENVYIDCLQYANWSKKIFEQMREGRLDCVHVTIAYHENFRETISNIENSIVMENCKINSSAEIKNSIIANNSDIKDDEGDKKIFLLGEGSKVSL